MSLEPLASILGILVIRGRMANFIRGIKILVYLTIVLQESDSCIQESSKFGFILNVTAPTFFRASSHEECSETCSRNQSCRSYNFHLKTFICQMLNISFETNPEKLIEAEDGIHMPNVYHKCFGDPCKGRGICLLENDGYYCLVFQDCAGAYNESYKRSGVYTIYPDSLEEFQVYCDQETTGGGWTIIQRRLDGSVNFERGWTDFKNGFGDVKRETWLGLEKMNRLTINRGTKLRVELEDTSGNQRFAEYDNFAVMGENTNYKLTIGQYTGDAGDSLTQQNNMPFSTKDKGKTSCVNEFRSAWWHAHCVYGNLNGLYRYGTYAGGTRNGMFWHAWKGYFYSLKRTEMKIRPMNF